jgi:hypothetical protein
MATVASLLIGIMANSSQAEREFRKVGSSARRVKSEAAVLTDQLRLIGKAEGIREAVSATRELLRGMADARVAGKSWTETLSQGFDELIEKGGILGKVIGLAAQFQLPFRKDSAARDIVALITGRRPGGEEPRGPRTFRQVTALTMGLGGLEGTQAARQTALLAQIAVNTRKTTVQ